MPAMPPDVDLTALVDCAMGRVPADLVILNGRWVSVQTGEIIPATDIAIKNGLIAYVGPNAAHTRGEKTRTIDARDRYLVPGLLDAHMHVESGMLTVTEFVQAVIGHGTTGMFIDPHEIANVFGMRGVKMMVDEAASQPIHVWVQMPSCVPSLPGFETSGARIGAADVQEAMTWPGIIGLGEMMNYPGVVGANPDLLAELSATRQAGKVIGGHYASPDLGLAFHGYVAGGAEDDHEGTRLLDAIARARQGMKVMLRLGSAWHDVAEQVRAITELHLDSRHFLLCTDDSHSETLVNEGHIDRVVRYAISQGIPPLTALQMATINTAEHFGVSREVGLIAPGRSADILIVSDLVKLSIDIGLARGMVVVEGGKVKAERPVFTRPEWAYQSVHLARPLVEDDFRLLAPHASRSTAGRSSAGREPARVTANVIGVIENQAPTRHIRLSVSVINGEVHPDSDNDLAKVAVIERHTGSGRIQIGLVQGFGFNVPCATGTTIVHDCHQLIVVGTDEGCMAKAANFLAEMGGGQVVVMKDEVIGKVLLPIGGLMSDKPAELVAEEAASILAGFKRCGCQMNNPNMQLSLLALVVIPSLRISDQGLVDVNHFSIVPVLE